MFGKEFLVVGMEIAKGKGSTLPIEERTHKDFYPDLSLTKDLSIHRITAHTKELIHQFYIQDPLPKFEVQFTKPIPKPVFSIIEHEAKEIPELQPFYRHIGRRV
jgi:hypothetical protein